MIYRLPTRGRTDNPYRGSYPNRVASFSGSRGCYHVELNSGARFVFTRDEILPPDLRPSFLGLEFSALFDVSPHSVQDMSLADYAGIMIVTRIMRGLRYNASYIDLVGNRMERR